MNQTSKSVGHATSILSGLNIPSDSIDIEVHCKYRKDFMVTSGEPFRSYLLGLENQEINLYRWWRSCRIFIPGKRSMVTNSKKVLDTIASQGKEDAVSYRQGLNMLVREDR